MYRNALLVSRECTVTYCIQVNFIHASHAIVDNLQDKEYHNQEAKILGCGWLPWSGYLTVDDSPGRDTSLWTTPFARIPRFGCAIQSEVSWPGEPCTVRYSVKKIRVCYIVIPASLHITVKLWILFI